MAASMHTICRWVFCVRKRATAPAFVCRQGVKGGPLHMGLLWEDAPDSMGFCRGKKLSVPCPGFCTRTKSCMKYVRDMDFFEYLHMQFSVGCETIGLICLEIY